MSGIYNLVSAGKALERKMEINTNNLTNVDTAGYKEDHLTFREVLSTANRVVPESGEELFQSHENLDLYVGMDKSSVIVDGIGKDFSTGPMRFTDNPLDIAIGNEGFFTVATPQGNRYSRTGQFTMDMNGTIVTSDGYPLLGEKGPIVVQGTDIKINEDGGVEVDGAAIDKLRLVRFRDPASLQKLGKSFYAPISSDNVPVPSDEIKVRQGMIEESNVNTITGMVKMIDGNRTYESVRKAMTTIDRLDEKAISISRIG
ncbi:MAG: flagellar basal-body rod protein FlgF [SAR324 cluster bacterium]|nr:flagellar basal-body rod protein FlgF [SAR324 cluster bacterium]